MAYIIDGTLTPGLWTKARSATAIIAADNATLSDANYPTAVDPTTGGPIDCTGWDTIIVKVNITAGTGPTMTLEALFRDGQAADQARWARRVNGSGAITTPAIASDASEAELSVDGWPLVFLRISAVANATSTTAWKIFARPGRRSVPRPLVGL